MRNYTLQCSKKTAKSLCWPVAMQVCGRAANGWSSYLQDRFLLFHLVTACVCRFLLAAGPAMSGREQRGVFISSSVASSGGEEREKIGLTGKLQLQDEKYHSSHLHQLVAVIGAITRAHPPVLFPAPLPMQQTQLQQQAQPFSWASCSLRGGGGEIIASA